MNHQRTLLGKIAHLPGHLRDQLNRRLYDGQYCPQILPWLNALPIVKQVLADHFDGKPINHRNISNWRATGYPRWLEENKPELNLEQDARKARRMARAARGIAAGAAALAANKIFHLLQQDLSTEQLLKAIPPVVQLVKAEHNSVRLKHEKKRLRQNDARIELARDKQQRDEAAIALKALADARAKDIEAGPGDYQEKLEILGLHMFGDLWLYRRPLSASSSSSDPSSSSSSSSFSSSKGKDPSGQDEPKSETPPAPPTEKGSAGDSPDASAGPSVPSPTSEDVSLSKNINEPGPNAVPSPPCPSPAGAGEGGPATAGPGEGIGGSPKFGGEGQGEGEGLPSSPAPNNSSLKTQNSNPENDTFGLRPPEITPGKTTAQLIAEIEEYTALLAVRRKAFLAGRSRGNEALNIPSSKSESAPDLIQPPAEILDATRNTQHASKPPLSDYEKALLAGKSRLEALYAQFTPTPEEFARRKRANEELRRASEPQLSTHPALNYQQFYGPCPAPSRPLDRWKVQTS